MSYDSTLRTLYVDIYFRCHQLMSSDKKQNFQKSFVFTPPDYIQNVYKMYPTFQQTFVILYTSYICKWAMAAKYCIQNIYKSLVKCGIHFVYIQSTNSPSQLSCSIPGIIYVLFFSHYVLLFMVYVFTIYFSYLYFSLTLFCITFKKLSNVQVSNNFFKSIFIHIK